MANQTNPSDFNKSSRAGTSESTPSPSPMGFGTGSASTSSNMSPGASSMSPGSNEGENVHEMREGFSRVTQNVRSRANQIANDVGDRASVYYDEASRWLGENSGRVIAVVGVLSAFGLIGYLLARRDRWNSSEFDRSDRMAV